MPTYSASDTADILVKGESKTRTYPRPLQFSIRYITKVTGVRRERSEKIERTGTDHDVDVRILLPSPRSLANEWTRIQVMKIATQKSYYPAVITNGKIENDMKLPALTTTLRRSS